MIYETTKRSREVLREYYNIKNIFQVAPALPDITSYLHSHITRRPPPQIHLREKLFFRMIYETTTQGGPGVQDRAVEPLHRRDHLQPNPRMLGFTRSTGYAILCIPKGKYNRWTRRRIPKTMKLTGNTSEML
ncbi:MAG: hypothetical protein E4G94_06225 [ANME-2 cluster archaeon]|nr:MAG: hypothetical protein E4G94_06225 [ANME-2 cluster archaeon]